MCISLRRLRVSDPNRYGIDIPLSSEDNHGVAAGCVAAPTTSGRPN